MALSQGVRLGHYEIVAPLGAGGMGAVYKATDTRLGRTVAIKVLPDHAAADPQRRLRFEQEARAVSALNHPNICVLYDVGRETPSGGSAADGREAAYSAPVEFLVMEHLEGETLSKRLREGGVSFDEALDIGAQVADALAKAHRHGVIHRDLKPGNVMLTKTGARMHAKLLDFGLAKLRPVLPSDVESTHPRNEPATRPGAVLGTVPYMSPEQLEGKPTDGRTDIFALGCVLYEMVTGRRAFGGDSEASIISAIMAKEPTPVASYLPAAPLALDHLIVRCLQKDPEERAESAHDVSEELRWIRQTHGSGSADGVSPHRRASDSASSHSQSLPSLPSPDPGGRWRRALIAVGIVTAALAVYTVPAYLRGWWPWTEATFKEAAPVPVTSDAAIDAEPAISPDGSQVAFVADEGGTPHIWVADNETRDKAPITKGAEPDHDPSWTPDGLRVLFARGGPASPRVFSVSRLGGEPKREIEDAAHPDVSFDGKFIAFVREVRPDGQKRVFVAPRGNPSGAKQITFKDDGKWDHGHPRWSPDGSQICYYAQYALFIVSPASRGARQITFDNLSAVDPAWSPDGKWIYYTSRRDGPPAIMRVRASGGTPERVMSSSGLDSHPTLSRDGRTLAYASGPTNQAMVVRDLSTGFTMPFAGGRLNMMPRFTADQSQFVFVSDRNTGQQEVWAQPLDISRPAKQLTDQPGVEADHPTLSPTGRWVAYYTVNANQRDICTVPFPGGGPPTKVTRSSADEFQPAWSPDEKWLAFVSERESTPQIRKIPVANGGPDGPEVRITTSATKKEAPEWSPDGQHIAFVGGPTTSETEVWVVPADGGSERQVTKGAGARRVRWLEDNRMVVNGLWGTNVMSLRVVDVQTGEATPLSKYAELTDDVRACDFDIDPARKRVVFSLQTGRSTIWTVTKRR